MEDESHDAFGAQRDASASARRIRWSPYSRGRWSFAVLDVLIVLLIGCGVLAETGLHRVDAIGRYASRPTWGLGQDWLLVLYDERGKAAAPHGIGSPAGAEPRRIDTLMLLHLASNGRKPTLIELPPDAYSPVSGHGAGSLRAAFAWGGPKLLVRTTESLTRVGIEHYVEIGFTGLARLVDLVGGVRICARPTPAGTPGAGASGTPATCPHLSGPQALAYLRSAAHSGGEPDHAEHQRRLVTALIRTMAAPGAALDPLRGIPLVVHAPGTVTTDEGSHLHDLIRLALALRDAGDVAPTVVSIVGRGSVPGVGRVVTLDPADLREIARTLVTDCLKAGCLDR